MRLRVVVEDGEPYEVNISPKVIVAAERHFAKPMSQLFGDSASFEALCWTAWKGTHASGRVVKPFDEWLDGVESIEAGESAPIPLEIR